MNLFDNLPGQTEEEVLTELNSREGVCIERIVSTGQATPAKEKPTVFLRNVTKSLTPCGASFTISVHDGGTILLIVYYPPPEFTIVSNRRS